MEMRLIINLLEAEDDIQKRFTDKRDIIQKYRDLIAHPTTDKHMREIAQRKLDKLLAAQEAEERANADKAEYDKGSAQVPATGLQVLYNGKPLMPDRWDEVFLRNHGKTLRFRTVLDRLIPLNPFKIELTGGSGYWVSDLSGHVWFYPEDEPETGEVKKALLKGGNIWADAVDDGKYFRGGISEYFINFGRFADKKK